LSFYTIWFKPNLTKWHLGYTRRYGRTDNKIGQFLGLERTTFLLWFIGPFLTHNGSSPKKGAVLKDCFKFVLASFVQAVAATSRLRRQPMNPMMARPVPIQNWTNWLKNTTSRDQQQSRFWWVVRAMKF